ncbi:hypothetical protein EVAR_18914_1 [Eumeta japonica]|uniref:Uncharacterized protein n=1 Tax=Eumeta variegata TaxID=151549 RepID=A0A4C1V1U4_EUMVA|nr:hypothetical protein EVAR_18914_1 [Eumeta japonica]
MFNAARRAPPRDRRRRDRRRGCSRTAFITGCFGCAKISMPRIDLEVSFEMHSMSSARFVHPWEARRPCRAGSGAVLDATLRRITKSNTYVYSFEFSQTETTRLIKSRMSKVNRISRVGRGTRASSRRRGLGGLPLNMNRFLKIQRSLQHVAGLSGRNTIYDGRRNVPSQLSLTGRKATAEVATSRLHSMRAWYFTDRPGPCFVLQPS